jgi:hypothetical protein
VVNITLEREGVRLLYRIHLAVKIGPHFWYHVN